MIEIHTALANDEFFNSLGSSIGSDIDKALLTEQLISGVAVAYDVKLNDKRIGSAIMRAETTDLVICCYAGKEAKKFTDKVKEIARLNGLKRVRFHTTRKGAGRFLNDTDFEIMETVYKVDIV